MEYNQKQVIARPNKIVHPDIALQEKPATRKLTLEARINRYTCDSNGTILNDAAVPVADRKPYPFHLFGYFDQAGGYALADGILQRYNTNLFAIYTHGIGTPMFFFSPLNTINNVLKKGDLVFLYLDDLNAPNIFTFIVVHAMSGGFASLTSETNIARLDKHHWGSFRFDSFLYSWSNDAQLDQPIVMIKTRYDGDFETDRLNPRSYRYTTEQPNVRTIRIPLQMLVNQYSGLSSYLDFNNSELQVLFELYL